MYVKVSSLAAVRPVVAHRKGFAFDLSSRGILQLACHQVL